MHVITSPDLVYARDLADPSKHATAAEWMSDLWRSRRGKTSIQVLNEYYTTVTRKLRPGLDANLARQDVERIMLWDPVELSRTVVWRAWRVGNEIVRLRATEGDKALGPLQSIGFVLSSGRPRARSRRGTDRERHYVSSYA
jgi:hypothetical protein